MLALGVLVLGLAESPWPMYGQGPAHGREGVRGSLWSGSITQSFKTEGWIYGAPAVGADETLYASSWDGAVYAITTAAGGIATQRWRFPVRRNEKIWSSPALGPGDVDGSNTTVFIGANESLLAIGNTAAGPVLRWAVKTTAPIFASPTVDPMTGEVFIGGLDGGMLCVAAAGVVRWNVGLGGPIYASAAVTPDAVFVATMAGKIVALSRGTGDQLWEASAAPHPVTSSPSLSPDQAVLYVASQSGELQALDAATGAEMWRFKVGLVDGSSPAVSAETGGVFIGSLDGHLYAIRPNGTLAWKVKADSQVQSSPAIGAGGQIYFTSFKATMYSVTADGTVTWTAPLEGQSFSSPALGRRGLYVGSSNGRVIAFAKAQ